MSYRTLANILGVISIAMLIMLINTYMELCDTKDKLKNIKPVVIAKAVPVKKAKVSIQDNIPHTNKNLLNIKSLRNDKWKGQIGTDKYGHAIFKDWEYGIRAASFVLKNYSKKHEISTIEDLIYRFCEGDRENYIAFLEKNLKIKRDKKIELIKYIPKLLRYMAIYESGNHKLPDKLFACYDVLEEI